MHTLPHYSATNRQGAINNFKVVLKLEGIESEGVLKIGGVVQ